MRRREFFALLGGAAAALPQGVRAQQPEGTRRIGFVGPLSEPTQLQWTTAFIKGLRDGGLAPSSAVR